MICVVLIELFINITLARPHLVLTRYPKVFVVIYDTLKEPNSLIGVAINSITSLASSWDCKIALDTPTSFLICDSQGTMYLYSTIIHYLNTNSIYR